MVDRCNRLMEAVRVEGVDAVLITSRINRMYFPALPDRTAYCLSLPAGAS